jgi:hypothetical protein
MPHEPLLSNRVNRSRLLTLVFALLVTSLVTPVSTSAALETPTAGLADATVLIIRHAEKPDSGTGLSSAGEVRAQAYVGYFQHLTLNGIAFRPDTLIATADSKNSARERLTLEPLSRALGIPLDLRFDNKDIAGLVHTQSCPTVTGRTTSSTLSWRFATTIAGSSFPPPSSSFTKTSQTRRD